MALVHDALLVCWQCELVLCVLSLILQVSIHSVSIGHNTGGLSLGFPTVKYTIVQHLEWY